MPSVHHDHVVEALPRYRADHPLAIWILPGSVWCGWDFFDDQTFHAFLEAVAVDASRSWSAYELPLEEEKIRKYGEAEGLEVNGAMCMWTNMGHGVVDWPAYLKLFEDLCPTVPFVLEIISYRWSNEAKYLEPGFWARFPKARAHEFARFVALAKRGKEFEIPSGRPTGAASPELEQAQQKFDLEESLKYCKQVLGLGLKE